MLPIGCSRGGHVPSQYGRAPLITRPSNLLWVLNRLKCCGGEARRALVFKICLTSLKVQQRHELL